MENKITYEEAIERLEEIVSKLEEGKAPLDESLKLFEEGTGLAAMCTEMLEKAKAKITEAEKE